jgi:DNA ligase D-like protein (predicted 3'-phosphoesterase)
MKELIFVVQEHHARKLHWDFRLEINKVLKSWAIPKKPPLKKSIKRLAVPVEDHSLEYANFEGTIPEGFYGAGVVKIWDKGNYEPEEISKDKIVVKLNGKKMKGRYALIKMKSGRYKGNWILFKC